MTTKSLTNKYFFFTLLLHAGVVAFLGAIQYLVFRHGNLYGIIDQGFPELNPAKNLYANLFYWDRTRGAGEPQYLFFLQNVEYFFVWLLSLVFHSARWINFAKILIAQYLYYLGGFFFLFSLLKFILKKPAESKNLLIASAFALLPIFNLYFFQSSLGFLFNQRYDLFVFGLLFYSINKVLFENKGWGLFIASSVLSIGCWGFLPFWIPLGGFIALYFLFFSPNYKKTALLAFVYSLIVMPALVTNILFYSQTSIHASTITQYKNEEFSYANRNSTLTNIFKFIGGVNWDLGWGWDNKAVYPYYTLFTPNGIFSAAGGFLFLLFLFGYIFRPPALKRVHLFLGGGALVCIFLIASYNPPFGSVFDYLIDHAPLFLVFRESHNKVYPLFLLIIVAGIFLPSFSISPRYKKILAGALAAYALVFVWTAFRYNFYHREGAFTFPENRYKAIKDIIPPENRTLFLPQYAYVKRYNFGYAGNTLTRFYFDYPQFEISYLLDTNFQNPKVRDMLDNFNFQQYEKNLYNFGLPDPTFDPDLLRGLGINFVVFDKNLVGDSSSVRLRNQTDYIKNLKSLKSFRVVLENNDFLVLSSRQPRQELEGPNLTFQRVSPVEYKIFLDDINNSEQLKFLESFDKNWKMYPVSSPSRIWCDMGTFDIQNGSTECMASHSLFTANGFSTLFKNPVFEATHTLTDGYANSWILDEQTVKNLGPEYYKQTPVGTSAEFILYYRPQNYFYAACLVSLLTIIASALYAGLTSNKRKNQS